MNGHPADWADHQVARVNALASSMQDLLDIGWLTVTHKFDPITDTERKVATTTADWEYRQATVVWSLCLLPTLTDEQLEAAMVHELVHVLLAPLWSSVPDRLEEQLHPLNEFATECVARSILAVVHA